MFDSLNVLCVFWQEMPVYTELNRENEEEKGN